MQFARSPYRPASSGSSACAAHPAKPACPAMRVLAIAFAASLAFAAVLSFALLRPGSAFATPEEGDQNLLASEEIEAAIESGALGDVDEKRAELDAAAAARAGAETSDEASLAYDPDKKLYTLAGEDRYDTSAQTALAGWSSAPTVILTTGENWVDALAISGFAGALDCPVLLTETDGLPDVVVSALRELGVTEVFIVGGTSAVSAQVESDLADLGISVVQRLAGDDRYGTQRAIYAYGAENGLWPEGGYAVVASAADDGFADALSLSSLAFAECYPVFLVNGEGALSDEQYADFRQGAQDGLIRNVLLAGGTARISDETEAQLRETAWAAYGTATRLAGDDRYETSAKVAEWAVDNGILTYDDAAVATGSKPYDALGGGALQGKKRSVLLLADENRTDDATGALKGESVETICFLGGASALPMTVRVDFANALGFSLDDIEDVSDDIERIYLDAGHGFDSSNNGALDVGATGNGYLEYELNNELANMVGDILTEEYGKSVYVNDDGGWFKLRQAEAEKLGCDCLVSIHFNASENAAATGTETYIHSVHAASGSEELQSRIHSKLVSALGLADRGMKEEEWAVCGGNVPATLLEICFISNADDMSTYQAKKEAVARAIAEGIAGYSATTPIMGESETTVAAMVERYEESGCTYPSDVYAQYGAASIEDFCTILYEEAQAEGVRAEVVFAQAMHETGWLQFGGDVQPEQCNFSGLGATGGVPGNSFNDWGEDSVRKGLRAQVQHLKAYASTDDLANECVDVRFGLVTRGCAPTVEGLSTRWAVGSSYGDKLVAIVNQII